MAINEMTEEERKKMALYPIGIAAEPLEYAPCWEIKDCPPERRDRCSEECLVYLSYSKSKKENENIITPTLNSA